MTIQRKQIRILHHGRTVCGELFSPKQDAAYPLVILSHGYNGTMKGFERLAGYLAKRGIGAFCYDFCGGSIQAGSSMKTTDMTILTEKEDLNAVLAETKKWDQVKQGHIFLFGESQGGLVTVLTAKEHETEIAGIILFCPALCIADNWNAKFPEKEDIPEKLEFWGMELGKNFFMTLRELRVFDVIKGFSKKALVMHGDQDTIVPVSYSRKMAEVCPQTRLVVFQGEGHGFSKEAYDRMCEMTGQYVADMETLTAEKE